MISHEDTKARRGKLCDTDIPVCAVTASTDKNVCATFNRQKTCPINTRFLKTATQYLLTELLGEKRYEVGIHLIDSEEMTRLNETFLQHEGSTDVITFDNREEEQSTSLSGEIFISIPDAQRFARQFRTDWQSEVARYIIHGILHLKGCDDLKPAPRRAMKREENRLLKILSRKFNLRNGLKK